MARINVRDKVTIITGASSGIGRETARAFAVAGARLVLAARSGEALDQLASELRQTRTQVLVVPTDVADRAATDALVARVHAEWQRIDILINNAGVGIQANVAQVPLDRLRYVFDVNLFGPIKLIQAVLPQMQQHRGGVIVNVSSPVAALALPGIGGYSATKAALDAISDTLRREVYASGIKVLTVYPGRIDTNFDQARIRVADARRVGRSPLTGSPTAVAKAILRGVQSGRRVVYAVHPLERLALLLYPAIGWALDPLFGHQMDRQG